MSGDLCWVLWDLSLIHIQMCIRDRSQLLHNILLEQTNHNIARIAQIQNLSNTLAQLFNGYTNSINTACRNLFKKLKYDEDEDPTIIFLSKFVVDLLTEMSKKFSLVSKKVKNQVIDPLEQFYQSQRDSYAQLSLKSGQLFTQI